jgi:hypothetical protein
MDGTGPGDRQDGLYGTAWLAPRLQMAFRPAASPVCGPVAKLGGQPTWLERPCWPWSAGLRAPMMFVGQFPLPGDNVPMAYLFITDDPDATAETFDPESGENALLVQPGGRVAGRPYRTSRQPDGRPSRNVTVSLVLRHEIRLIARPLN